MNARGANGHVHPLQSFVPMKRILTGLAGLFFGISFLHAQEFCEATQHLQQQVEADASLLEQMDLIEQQISRHIETSATLAGRGDEKAVIKIPVVFHVLYHESSENISESKLIDQISILNEAFRRLSADTSNTPERFRALAADCEIEFQLAISDPQRRATSGIQRYYTPITYWDADDKMKSAANMGADAWDASQYLNIWVCNLRRGLGYASFPGGDKALDGVVLNAGIVGTNASSSYGEGKVAVHEVGHWLGLRHIWGDDYCGDDLVDDTPKQAGFTSGCPSGVRSSCGNGVAGDMYMNYMDLTSDPCTNLFTIGQKNRMRALFASGGDRASILQSVGLKTPTAQESPIQEPAPRWLKPNLFPNPAKGKFTLDLAYDPRWVGHTLTITNMQGKQVKRMLINTSILEVDISRFVPGIYFISCQRSDGKTLRHKLVVQ